jgi:hypothetical protein
MAEENQNANQEAVKVPATYGDRLFAEGWNLNFISAKAKDLDNPELAVGTLGFYNVYGQKQVIVSLPIDEWVKVLTAVAKKAVKK